MTFEGHQIQGAPKILEKVQVSADPTQPVGHNINTSHSCRVWVFRRSPEW